MSACVCVCMCVCEIKCNNKIVIKFSFWNFFLLMLLTIHFCLKSILIKLSIYCHSPEKGKCQFSTLKTNLTLSFIYFSTQMLLNFQFADINLYIYFCLVV